MDPFQTQTVEPPIRILVVEDDAAVGEALVKSLERCGMHTTWTMSGREALALKSSFAPDVVLLDLALPDMDGIELVRFFAKGGDCGVIIVSGLNAESDRIVGLELGADDYVAKPPHVQELRARIRAVYRRIRRRRSVTKAEPERSTVRLGSITIDLVNRAVRSSEGRISLTAAEFTALEMLLTAQGETVSRDRLCEASLHRPWRAEDRSVDQLIFTLRHKLSHGDQQHMIHSVRGAGYMLAFTETPVEPVAEHFNWQRDMVQS